MKQYAQSGMMVLWVVSICMVFGLLCLASIRIAADFFDIGIERIMYQQNLRALHMVEEYGRSLIGRYKNRATGYYTEVSIPEGVLPSPYQGRFAVNVQSKSLEITFVCQHGTFTQTSQIRLAKD